MSLFIICKVVPTLVDESNNYKQRKKESELFSSIAGEY